MIALALSPHLDDAVFSCGGTLTALASAGWRVELATIFTASVPDPAGFALACQLDKGLGPEVDYMALRREEDAGAARVLELSPPRWLPFREAPHRGYGSAPALFAGVRPDDRIEADLARALAGLIADTRPALILAPQAIGGHVDHVQVTRALRGLDTRTPVLWWEDFPYTVRHGEPARPFAGFLEALPTVRIGLSPEAQERKRLAAQAYASQLGFQFGGAERLDRLLSSETAEHFRAQGEAPGLLRALLARP